MGGIFNPDFLGDLVGVQPRISTLGRAGGVVHRQEQCLEWGRKLQVTLLLMPVFHSQFWGKGWKHQGRDGSCVTRWLAQLDFPLGTYLGFSFVELL